MQKQQASDITHHLTKFVLCVDREEADSVFGIMLGIELVKARSETHMTYPRCSLIRNLAKPSAVKCDISNIRRQYR